MMKRLSLLLACLLACRSGKPDVSDATTPVDAPPPKASATSRASWNGQGDFQFFATDFHFELGGTQVVAVAADGSVRDLFVRHRLEQVSAYCKDPPVERREVCADLQKHGEKQVGTQTWFLARYPLTQVEHAELRARLLRARMGDLQPLYQQKDLQDGTTRSYNLITAAATPVTYRVSVYAANQPMTPAGLVPVADFVRDLPLAHEEARRTAPPASDAERIELTRLADGNP